MGFSNKLLSWEYFTAVLCGLHVSDVSGYLIVSAKSSCHDIMCESIPGSPHLFLFFRRAMGEPDNEAMTVRWRDKGQTYTEGDGDSRQTSRRLWYADGPTEEDRQMDRNRLWKSEIEAFGWPYLTSSYNTSMLFLAKQDYNDYDFRRASVQSSTLHQMHSLLTTRENSQTVSRSSGSEATPH